MITFINESLFSIESEKRDGKDGAPDYYRMIVSSSMPVLNRRNVEEKSPKVIEHILYTQEDNFNQLNTSIRMSWVNKRKIVLLNQKPTNEIDMPVYIIAVPYNGFITPIEKSDMYDIYKGSTVTLEDPIEYQENTYKHIVYITMVPKMTEEKPAVFTIEGFSIRKDLEGEDQKTFKTVWTFEFKKEEDGSINYEMKSDTSECEPVEFEHSQGAQLFPIVQPMPRPKKTQQKKPVRNNKPNGKPQDNNKRKPVKKEYSKPNNNGSKKRPPSNNRPNNHSNRSIGTSLDEMLRECERARQENQNRKKGKKRRGRR